MGGAQGWDDGVIATRHFQSEQSPPDRPEDPRYRLVYEEAVRGIDQQEATLDNLRARAGTVLALASLVTSFLGAAALTRYGFGPAAGVATALFVATGVLVLSILLPRQSWKFRVGAKTLIGQWIEVENPVDMREMHRDLALYLEKYVDENQPKIDELWRLFQASCLALVAETVTWVLALAHI